MSSRFWGPLLVAFALITIGSAQQPVSPYRFQCSDKIQRSICDERIEILRRIISRQGSLMPAGWTWTLVADADWPFLTKRYHLQHDFVFTHMGERRTFLNVLLFEGFRGSTWEWAVAHETAHVVCDLVDDREADRVADRLLKKKPMDWGQCTPRRALPAEAD
jgi:hypothetical protein